MKKFLLACLMALFSLSTWANGTEVDGIYYTFSGSEATVTYTGTGSTVANNYDGDIIIPSEVTYSGTTYTVTAIGDYAFHGQSSSSKYSTVSSVKIPDTVTKIGNYAFQYNSALKEIEIPNTVTSIGTYAFRCCTALESITLPDAITKIDNYTFHTCSSLTKVTYHGADEGGEAFQLPSTCYDLCEYAFYASGLSGKITIPSTVTIIDAYAFGTCNSITEVVFEASETPITLAATAEYAAFHKCTGLQTAYLYRDFTLVNGKKNSLFYASSNSNRCSSLAKVVFGGEATTVCPYLLYNTRNDGLQIEFEEDSKITEIGSYAFYYCNGMENIDLPETLTTIGHHAFDYCTALTSVVLPKNVETVKSNAFINSKVTSITFPKSIKTIEGKVFYNCSSLEAATFELDANLTSIGDSIFMNCSKLQEIVIPNALTKISANAFNGCSALASITISDNSELTAINDKAFMSCSSLTEITIPASVTTIGTTSVWNGCTSLKKIHLLGTTPPEIVVADLTNDGDMDWPLVIYVPYGYEEAYEQSTWYTNVVGYSTYQGKIIFNSSLVTIDALDASGAEDYASYYHPYALTIPDGVKAYAITNFSSDGTLTMSEVTEVIPQHSAVLLEREATSGTSSYRIYIAEDDTHTAISGNLLYGSEQSTTTSVNGETEGYYFYGLTTKNNENLGFYWGAENGAAFTIPANKAWLALPSAEATNISYLKLKKDGNTTGIESIEAAEATNNGAIYTLQGVRVSDMSQKGVYIVNGKKVLVK